MAHYWSARFILPAEMLLLVAKISVGYWNFKNITKKFVLLQVVSVLRQTRTNGSMPYRY